MYEIELTEAEKIESLMLKYQFAKQMLETEIDILMKEFTYKHGYNPVEHIKSRIKTEASIRKKLEDSHYDYSARSIMRRVNDVVGIRIVCSFLTDVFDIVSIIEHSKNIIVKERRDYIASPKETGYSSYHLIVLIPIYLSERVEYIECEIQIRTMAMDFWASLDHKISYKFQDTIPDEVKSQMRDYAQTVKELDKKMMDLNDLVNKYHQRF